MKVRERYSLDPCRILILVHNTSANPAKSGYHTDAMSCGGEIKITVNHYRQA